MCDSDLLSAFFKLFSSPYHYKIRCSTLHLQSIPIRGEGTSDCYACSNQVQLAVLILWLVSVILTGSADSSILASDVETGKAIARLEDAHEYAFFVSC
jgi:hypothetical protein